VSVNNEDPDELLRKELEEAKRIKLEIAKKKQKEKEAAQGPQDPGEEPPVIKEKWRKRTTKFVIG